MKLMTLLTLKLAIFSILFSVTAMVISIHAAQAQLEGSPVQRYGPEHGVMMQFSYYPPNPTINGFTNLTFNILNSTTQEPIQNFVASVMVGNVVNFTGGSSLYNFSKITVPNGNFSVSYAFPNDGTFPVYLRVDTPSTISIARFQVLVPPPIVVPGNDYTMIYVGIAIAAAGAGVGIVMIQKRKKPKRSNFSSSSPV
jgi:hypothetical protein